MITPPQSHCDLRDWLRLIRSENIGPVTFYQLLTQFGSAKSAIEAIQDAQKTKTTKRPIKLAHEQDIDTELKNLDKKKIHLIPFGDPLYPTTLKNLSDAPPLISARGDISLLHAPSIAIVGARNASLNAKKLAYSLAQQLGKEGYHIVSGLARGIDTQAHKGALKNHKTIAVLAGGVDVVYPSENESLYQEIIENGVIISETALGLQPQAKHFPRRNRLVSGLSRGVVVVEAALKSGSLITAKFALDQGREVFAVPGSPLDPRCRGSNNLLRHGAVLTEGLQDILENMPAFDRPESPKLSSAAFYPTTEKTQAPQLPLEMPTASNPQNTVIENLSFSPIGVDELIRQCQTSPQEVWNILLELELDGRLERHPNNKVSLAA